jgi:amino acid transporter
VAAVTSALQGTSLAWLAHYPVELCLAAILFITVVNLRGLREAGAVFAVPVYLFLFSFLAMIAWGLIRYYWLGGATVPNEGTLKIADGYSSQDSLWFLLLAAFSGGCTAMTGVEAISNGVPAFRKPESRNAAITLLCMATVLTVLFLGTSTLAYLYNVQPHKEETAISQFARIIFPGPMTWAYYLIQATTAAILILAANTSYADFPRLGSLMAKDGFLPRQFGYLGDRLVYSNGIVVLATMAAILVWAFDGEVSRLIPLYAIGVFLSFTLSQAGMVRHWWKLGASAHLASMAVNALGATVTAVVLCVFVLTKFIHGAWVVVVVLPSLVLLFSAIGRHYRRVEVQLTRKALKPVGPPPRNTIILPVPRVHRGVRNALAYARCVSGEVRAIYIEIDPDQTEQVQKDWAALATGTMLEVAPSPYRAYVSLLLAYIKRVRAEQTDGVVTVLLAEFVPATWWAEALHNSWIFWLKAALLYQPGIVVTSVPFMLHE